MMHGRFLPHLLVLVLPLAGCGTPPAAPPAADAGTAPKSQLARMYDVTGNAGLPGPPSATRAPSSRDPAERAVEEILFRNDGGRVVLKAIRAQGGWMRWAGLKGIHAAVRPAGPDAAAAPVQVSVSLAEPKAIPETVEGRLLAAPFWMANPELRLEYLGVEVAPSGETYDKVRVFLERPGSPWWIASFNRRTAVLERILEPVAGKDGGPGSFRRTDLDAYREVAGLWLPGLWRTYELRTAFARPEKPLRAEAVEAAVEPKDLGL